MSKILAGIAALTLMGAATLPIQVSAAERHAGASTLQSTDISSRNRRHHWRHHGWRRQHWRHGHYRPYWGPRYYAGYPYGYSYYGYPHRYYSPGLAFRFGPFGFGFF